MAHYIVYWPQEQGEGATAGQKRKRTLHEPHIPRHMSEETAKIFEELFN